MFRIPDIVARISFNFVEKVMFRSSL